MIFFWDMHPIYVAAILQELANYGEYSGAPSEQMTYNYAKTILGLMTRVKDDKGKVRTSSCLCCADIIRVRLRSLVDVKGTWC